MTDMTVSRFPFDSSLSHSSFIFLYGSHFLIYGLGPSSCFDFLPPIFGSYRFSA